MEIKREETVKDRNLQVYVEEPASNLNEEHRLFPSSSSSSSISLHTASFLQNLREGKNQRSCWCSGSNPKLK